MKQNPQHSDLLFYVSCAASCAHGRRTQVLHPMETKVYRGIQFALLLKIYASGGVWGWHLCTGTIVSTGAAVAAVTAGARCLCCRAMWAGAVLAAAAVLTATANEKELH